MNIEFLLACNLKEPLIEELRARPAITTLYGKLPKDIVGGGRASLGLPTVTHEQFARYVQATRESGKHFNYLLNAACLGNQEWQGSWQRKLDEFLHWLIDIGVTEVTVAVPFMLRFVKERAPHVRVAVSKFARVNSVQRAVFWAKLGADDIHLDPHINRDFQVLAKIRQAVDIALTLFANEACLYQCPFEEYHGVMSAHASQSENHVSAYYPSYCSLYCRVIMGHNPAEIIRARFIRPEDISIYQEIGYSRFKLVDRFKDTDWLLHTTDAYIQQHYNGNLADILGRFETFPSALPSYIREHLEIACASAAHLLNYDRRSQYFWLWPIIDNRQLDGFLKAFENIDCKKQVCDQECHYCQEVAAHAVRWVNLSRHQEILNTLEAMFKALHWR